MKLWADFYPRVMPYVMGCPAPVVDAALIDAAREFCEKTSCWKQTERVYAIGGQSLLEFELPMYSEIVRVGRCIVNGLDYAIKPAADLPEDWESNQPSDHTLYHDTQQEYRLFPAPAQADVISMTTYLRPTLAGTGVDDETFALYAEAIAAGARAKLQRMPRQPWTDLNHAGIDGIDFMRQISAAANRDFMRSTPHRVKKAGL